jgi:hypothetical protein
VKMCLLYKRRFLELWLVQNLGTSYKSLFKELRGLLFPCQYIFSLMNFMVNNKGILKRLHLCTVLIQRIGTIFIDQMLTFHVFRLLASKVLTFYHVLL